MLGRWTGREGQNASVRRPGPERGLGGVSPSPLVARAMGRVLPLDLQPQDRLLHSSGAECRGGQLPGKPGQRPTGLQGKY